MNATCHFCDLTTELGTAINHGWTPYFYEGQHEVSGPVCPDCVERHLIVGPDDEYEAATKRTMKMSR